MKFNSKMKKIISLVLTVAIVIIAIGAVTSFTAKTTKRISSFDFSRGALDVKGEYVKTNKSLYTKEMFGCSGLKITVDFEAKVRYDVYFYDANGNFQNMEVGLTGNYELEEDPPFLPLFARVVIHPEIPAGESNFEIKFWEIHEYAKGLNIQVDKNQKCQFEGEATIDYLNTGKYRYEGISLNDDGTLSDSYSSGYSYINIPLNDLKYLYFDILITDVTAGSISLYGINSDSQYVLLRHLPDRAYNSQYFNSMSVDLRVYEDIEYLALEVVDIEHEEIKIWGYY